MSVASPTSATTACVAGCQEIFSSIQGEGLWVGKRQIFVRFNACHLHCSYCDTPQRPAAQQCEVEWKPGSGQKELLDNPLSTHQVEAIIRHFHQLTPHHSMSLTGGEPLLYTDFLSELLPRLNRLLPIYLETSGTQPEKLEIIWPWVDIIAMDIKLASATGEAMALKNHQEFYQLSQRKPLFVKLVISAQTTLTELHAVRDIVTDAYTPIVLQPVTCLQTGENTVPVSKIFELEMGLSQYFHEVRVIPQTHKMLAML